MESVDHPPTAPRGLAEQRFGPWRGPQLLFTLVTAAEEDATQARATLARERAIFQEALAAARLAVQARSCPRGPLAPDHASRRTASPSPWARGAWQSAQLSGTGPKEGDEPFRGELRSTCGHRLRPNGPGPVGAA